jgi:dipeptidyl aminopeptidase/acylaminoacyl peptidase
MAIQGHSFGGYETNYIITQTEIFAAACAASGFSDLISWYTSAARGSYPMYWAERHQGRMDAMPWENIEAYLKNSPILHAHKIRTPLLMMNNNNDKVVLFNQGLEFFTALRRLGKKAWMLQYDGGGHSIGGKAAEDFHIRMMQFFDHYLKDSACPKWMLQGIPAKMKGIDNGLNLVREKDKNGKWLTPAEGGLLTTEEKKKAEALKKRKPITITLK